MSTLIIDDKAAAEREATYDSEVRFRPMANTALTTVGGDERLGTSA